MQVLGLDWVGTRTSRFDETVDFFATILDLPVGVREIGFVRLDLPDWSCVEVFGPTDSGHAYFTTGPVVGFRVDDLDAAHHDLERHGIELLGRMGGERGATRWQHFRAPDGNVYEVVETAARPAPRPPSDPLRVTKLAWVGTRSPRYDEMVTFFRDVLGLETVEDLPELTEFRLPDGASAEVFLPGTPFDHPHFDTGPVPGFGVERIESAVGVLRARKIPIVQSKISTGGGWAHFRGADGNVYELKE
jgi:catechol 2,3-dioxygenase-like lactoylglutathione lyase family enzyme